MAAARTEQSGDIRPLRIAMVHASDLGGGAERSVISLHRALRGLGHHSTVFVGEKRTDEEGVVQIPYVRGLPGSRRIARTLERRFGWQDIYNPSFRALEQLIAGQFDVIHFNSLWGSAGFADIGALPALTRSVPGVLTMRENWLLTGHCACFDACNRWKTGCGACPDLERVPRIPRDGTAFNWRRKYGALQSSRISIVAISDWLLARAKESPITAKKPLCRIYNGIDLGVFQPCSDSERLSLRSRLGIADDEVVVLIAGQTVNGLNGFRAPKDALKILREASGLFRLRVLVIGQNSCGLAKELGPQAIALPFQECPKKMAACYQVADATLVTSEAEAFGRIAAESQACATPVVAFDTGAIPEVVLDGIGGFLVPRGNAGFATEKLIELARGVELRKSMGRRGLRHVRENFADELVAGAYVNLYRSIRALRGRGLTLSCSHAS